MIFTSPTRIPSATFTGRIGFFLIAERSVCSRRLGEQTLQSAGEKIHCDEKAFRFMLNADAMATEKLAEGIRLFCADTEKLEQLIINN